MNNLLKQMTHRKFRLGIYGGTFDPVHWGHLILTSDALEQLELDAVLFVPCRQSPHKMGHATATPSQRLSLLRKALRGHPKLWISRCELDRPAPSYAIDTAREIQEAFPRAQLFWLIGADQLPKLATWKDFAALRKQVTFVVLSRGKNSRKRLPAGVIHLPRERQIDISASEIRERVKKNQPINHLVPPAVATAIQRSQLYRSPIT